MKMLCFSKEPNFWFLAPKEPIWQPCLKKRISRVNDGRLALSVKSWPHRQEFDPLAGCSLEQGTEHQAHGPMLLPPAVALKLRLRLVQLRAVSRCCIVYVCHRFTMLRLLWFMCRDCARLSAINKARKLEGKPPYARRRRRRSRVN